MTKHTPYKGSPEMCTCSNSETGGQCVLHDPPPKHTPAPWHLVGQDIRDAEEDNIVTVPFGDDPERAEANALRIVSCVNGCEGINPDAVPELLVALKDLMERLPAILSVVGSNARLFVTDRPMTELMDQAVAALAKAEGK